MTLRGICHLVLFGLWIRFGCEADREIIVLENPTETEGIMTAETQTLNFGPEWLRALSSGGSVISPPPSPALPKYKLADHRYGREEMLALYVKDNKVPSDLLDKEFLPILKEEPLLPLALVPFTDEEQRNFSLSVNSSAVLRLTTRGSSGGGGTVVGAPRGRSTSRGRGRGRGESGFYQRSFDEVESGFGRGAREMHRSQSWEERGDRRFEKPRKEPVRPTFEEGGTAPAGRKQEFVRAESGSWRSLREELNDGTRGTGWREIPDRRRRFDYELREREDERGYRRVRSGSGSAEDERDSLPEWCLDDAEDETGTFDSSGAFLSSKPSKKVQKESIPEEQELDFQPSVEGVEHSDSDGNHSEEGKETDLVSAGDRAKDLGRNDVIGPSPEHRIPSPVPRQDTSSEPPLQKTVSPLLPNSNDKEARPQSPLLLSKTKEDAATQMLSHQGSKENTVPCIPHSSSPALNQRSPQQLSEPHPVPVMPTGIVPQLEVPAQLSVCAAPGMGPVPPEPDEDDGLEHLEQQAQQIVAYLQDGTLDDDRLLVKVQDLRGKGPSLDSQQKWYYKDPQGEIQGPFSNREMAEWYQAGYFPMTLLLRRVCDDAFQTLGDIIKKWGRLPFSTPAAPRHSDLDSERFSRQQEISALYQIQQLHYQQFLLRQQYAQVFAQQQKAALSPQHQQLPLPLQSLNMRIPEHTVITPVARALADTTSLWELPPAAPQPTVWEGSSVWDLPMEPTSQGTTLEQLEQMEKAKAAKLEQERREAELRAKQEERERQQLAEDERKRQEEEDLARRNQEEALRRQKELALQRQLEEEERQRKEELRQLEERRRQEEEKKRLEEERRQHEEERKRAEEERRKREEEKKKEEEERRQREEIQRKQEEAARWAREEEEAARRLIEEARQREEEEKKKREEAQRQKELQRQRQQQQEALRRLQQQQQQQQLAQMKLPSSSTWGQQVSTAAASQSALSLAEIQRMEEERERKQREEQQRRQQQEIKVMQHQQQQQQQQQKIPGWGNVIKSTSTTKSLVEIQQEEAKQMQKQQQQQTGRNRPANISLPAAPVVNNHNSSSNAVNSGNSVWGSLNNNLSPQWSSDSISSIWSNTENKGSSAGFWDDAVKEVAPRNSVSKNKNNASKSLGGSKQNKKVEQEEKLLRLFQGANKCQDGFTQWCEQTLHLINTAHSLDVPTFISFLREVESPYEVHDYVRAYLGDTPEAKDFGKQFVERRSKQKASQQRQQQDVAWGMYQQSPNHSQEITLEASQCAGRKKKKQKMVRADPSLLGFSVNASSERLNMGEIETVEDY
ncbi:hypothetical protein GDO86_010261 [Hymenochirus boettgeri]|uniref:GYF domain-containing protein n=1 Tax=Hymenochirus boettgeri TaxID=247094 RepID=A0A8T2JNR2_9PIPI|nr:hypothetical protein GDO86_010261 [Hymenochirus boettgeri]